MSFLYGRFAQEFNSETEHQNSNPLSSSVIKLFILFLCFDPCLRRAFHHMGLQLPSFLYHFEQRVCCDPLGWNAAI